MKKILLNSFFILLSISSAAQSKLYYAKNEIKDILVGYIHNDTIYITDKNGQNPLQFGYIDSLFVYYTFNRKAGDPILEIVSGTVYLYDSEDGAWGLPATINNHKISSPFGQSAGTSIIGYSDNNDVKSLAALVLIQIESWRNSNSPFYNNDKK